jgi:glycosyltransferase involved in cell wall biosynthesis
MLKSKSLLLIGGSKGNAHLLNYRNLIEDCFDDILIVSNQESEQFPSRKVNFELKNPFAMWKNVQILRKIIQEEQPDIIHVHQANAYGFITALANRGRRPLVVTTWGSDVLTLPHTSFLHRWMVQYILRSADAITADAQFMADAIHGLIGQVPVTVANFGVEIQNIEEGKERKNIIYSNRMHESLYQIDQIIQQLAPFLSKNPEWKLRIAASGSQTENLQNLAKEYLPEGSFEFLGFQAGKDNQQNYLQSKVYVSIPTTDGTSISLLESLAYGCLPIVSDLPANREWIQDGVNGIISSGDLSKDVERLLQLDASSIQERNKEIIDQKATKNANRKKFTTIYEAIFSGAAFKAK